MARFNKLATLANSLTGRMVLGLGIMHALLLPLFFGSALYLLKEGHETQFVNTVRIDAHLFAALLAHDVSNEPRLHSLLTDAVMGGQLIFAQIVTQQGKIIESSTGIQLAPEQFQEDFLFGQHNDTVYYIAIPLYDTAGDVQADLRIGFDERPTQELIHTAYWRSLMLAGAYAFLTIVLIIMLALQLTRPLRRLSSVAQRISAGDITKQLQVDTHITEINSLADDLESMRRELINQSEIMEHQALHDALTGLPNRNLLDDRIDQALITARRSGKMLALCMLDLNRFKEINDTLGHHAGDLVLQQVALRIRGALRESDTVARLGGDEFCILMLSVDDREHVVVAMEKLLATLEEPLEINGQILDIGASIGIALYPEHGRDNEALMRHADMAMYHAKNTASGFSLNQHEQILVPSSESQPYIELQHAIQHNELVLHYQPRVHLSTGQINSVETLIRWQHPVRGLLQPAEFLPLAEASGLINALMLWVVDTALQQAHVWHKAGHRISVTINLSARNLRGARLPQQLEGRLAAWAIDASWLALDIREDVIINEPQRVTKLMTRLAESGAKICIDDFGSTPMSLAFLSKLPLHEIKIDRSAINALDNTYNLAIVRGAIAFAHRMGFAVGAKGVESRQTADNLKRLGCDNAQGNYFSHALPVDEMTALLNKTRKPASN
jgi:diguanylate cyclase (GGDEF)-like protein